MIMTRLRFVKKAAGTMIVKMLEYLLKKLKLEPVREPKPAREPDPRCKAYRVVKDGDDYKTVELQFPALELGHTPSVIVVDVWWTTDAVLKYFKALPDEIKSKILERYFFAVYPNDCEFFVDLHVRRLAREKTWEDIDNKAKNAAPKMGTTITTGSGECRVSNFPFGYIE